ncbi:hypothetical protein [Nonomuraea candida]|uniref:hypothetical protein n=1 Tax=Nonomuraea candida TaxID=359159 RepID=UPI000A3DA91F|nr:hypothetical protein [Nonomuraea candida]
MRTNLATRAGLLGAASAAALSMAMSMASAPAQAAGITLQASAAAASSSVQRVEAVFGQAAAKRAKWVTLKHQSKRDNIWSVVWDRKYGHRVMQVKARCWGKGQTMRTVFEYRNRWGAWRIMKTAKWPCDGTPRYLRVTNAGHKCQWPLSSPRRRP